MTLMMSWRTAPPVEVMTPMERGKAGSGRLRAASKRPSASRRALSWSKASWKGAGAAGLEGFGDELELAAGLVDGDAAACQDGEAVLRAEAEEQGLAAEEHDRKLGVAIFEREIDVAGGRGPAVGDLAFDPDVVVVAFELLADAGDQVANGPDAALGGGSGQRTARCYGGGGPAARLSAGLRSAASGARADLRRLRVAGGNEEAGAAGEVKRRPIWVCAGPGSPEGSSLGGVGGVWREGLDLSQRSARVCGVEFSSLFSLPEAISDESRGFSRLEFAMQFQGDQL